MSDTTDGDDGALDPRIQIELENLNTATDEINRLEIALDEANTTFRILLSDCTRRLKNKSKSLGSCVEKARPYYEALEVARQAQLECQRAAVHYQRANEIHAAAKETVALAEARFLSKQHEWQFDNAWQEMLNHATIKVRDAETQKAESGREHHKRAMLFNAAEQKVQQLEQRLHRQIIKSRPYFDEKLLCNEQLASQKERVEVLQSQVSAVKGAYAASLKELERISEEIHCKRNKNKRNEAEQEPPCGPREPGVGAELEPVFCETPALNAEALDCASQVNEKIPEVQASENITEESKDLVSQETSQPSPEKLVPSSQSSQPRSNLTALPLLDNLTHLMNSNESPLNNPSPSVLNLPASSEIFHRSNTFVDDFGKDCKTVNEREEAYNHALLNHLMENYESELDRCDMTSLSGMSVTTGSSAVSEKDENDCYLDEELDDLPEQFQDIALEASLGKRGNAGRTFSLPGSTSGSRNQSANQSPVKNALYSTSTLSNSKSCNNILGKAANSSVPN
ncbi:SH3 domain-binding protein 5-like protein [Frankliniella fusca]|uniref:SH3 domain-binding protein 5-like protein n=1 Tax=Frankliniella fusca TaxID=407009 RepID=A0AAE1GZU4_9NEOP|nr:SH3 domain-binding protein 5-like protein [Frankliniella fusca]